MPDKKTENYESRLAAIEKDSSYMMFCPKYRTALPRDTTLCVYEGEDPIFSSRGKWLMPIFELERFLGMYSGSREHLSAHDTAVGKAAAVMMVRLGIKRIHANLASGRALSYLDWYNGRTDASNGVSLTFDRAVPALLCATEDILEPMTDMRSMYRILRQRAKLVQGASVVVERLSCPFGSIRDLSFTLPAGGNLLIVGGSGSGKTTLLRHLSGTLAPASGRVLIDGSEISAIAPRAVCYVPQRPDSGLFSVSVEEAIGLGLACEQERRTEKIRDAMIRTGCEHLAGRACSTLGGVEALMVSVSRCLAQNAGVLLLDEPSSGLDGSSCAMVLDVLRSISVTEIPTIIAVSRDERLMSSMEWETLMLGFAS